MGHVPPYTRFSSNPHTAGSSYTYSAFPDDPQSNTTPLAESESTWSDCTGKDVMLRILVGIILAGLSAYLAYVCVSQGLSRLHHTPALGGFLIYMGSAFGLGSLAQMAWTSWRACDSDEFSAGEACAQTAALFATPVAAPVLPIFGCCWLGRS